MPDNDELVARSYGGGSPGIKVLSGIILIICLMVLAGFSSFRLAQAEYERDVRHWESKLGIVLEARLLGVSNWVDTQFSEMQAIADNMSLRLYMTEHDLLQEGENVADAESQLTYLRNYLAVTAERAGFSAPGRAVAANVANTQKSGIVLLDKKGEIVAATAGMALLDEGLKTFIESAPKAEKVLRDLTLSEDGTPYMGFLIPVFAIQGDATPESQIGYVLGLREVKNSLYGLLKLPKTVEETAESLLVRDNKGVVEYISPLRDGARTFNPKPLQNTPEFAARFAMDNPGTFALKRDYAFQEVLVIGDKVRHTPWTLLYKVQRDEALAESEERRLQFISIGLLVVGVLVLIVIASWRHGKSVRAIQDVERYRKLAEKFRSQERLLRLVSDNQPDVIYILDKDDHYCFANAQASEMAGISVEDMVGKDFRSVVGPSNAFEYQRIKNNIWQSEGILSRVQRIDGPGKERVVQFKYIPLNEIPRILRRKETSGVLVVEQDITAAITERERRERVLKQIADTLILLVDRRDPYSAWHSARVSKIASAVAKTMHLDEVLVETVNLAGKLMNLGKILLPRDLLTKKDALTEEERKHVGESIEASAKFLEGIEFDGPVVDTIRQSRERWDGEGPLELQGEGILITARIISLANAYVAMMSPRAYRERLKREDVLQMLIDDIGKCYDRRVVVAFVSYIENSPHDDEEWEHGIE